MKRYLLILPLSFGILMHANADEKLEEIHASFLALEKKAFAPQRFLDEKYEAQLDALAEKARQNVDLDLVVQVRDEKARYRTDTPEEASKRIHDPQLTKLRGIYDTASANLVRDRTEALSAAYRDYLKDLRSHRDFLTKSGRVDEAVEVDSEIKKIEKQAAEAEALGSALDRNDSGPPTEETSPEDDLKAQIVGEWQYRENGRTWRRIFLPDGRIELWLDGHRDGNYLSEFRWRVEKRGILYGAWIFRGEKEAHRLRISNGGKTLKWGDGPTMQKADSDDLWK